MKLIYGTKNPAKLESMRRILKELPIEVVGLNELSVEIGEVEESGNSPLDNARLKAEAYYSVLKEPVFSCDSGLYIDGLDEERQPGVYARRVKGKTLSDDEMIKYYAGIAKEFGGKVTAQYKNAICLVMSNSKSYESMDEDISSERFILTDKPHPVRIKGFPLDSISIDENTGEYYMDIKNEETESDMIGKGFREFFAKVINKIEP
ncbi:MAG: non-canonical purine NTP pyrophosphatase [Clostridium sp.]|uniref:non-canonical purine NTP pyrophosphatase n=1 Tax=Clostridium culturomicium TaxID=1499683 RepID=UPI00058D8854|nr:non-canonical purine NTP pyrophosphatase [Clostridium culturomicium]MDU4889541.1 non-canonical purine NTP pyrophosphatase [Clostridium sp.]MDU7082815.1 non-canonical purine NTP pyrophosphatase [Clostridium sp.]